MPNVDSVTTDSFDQVISYKEAPKDENARALTKIDEKVNNASKILSFVSIAFNILSATALTFIATYLSPAALPIWAVALVVIGCVATIITIASLSNKNKTLIQKNKALAETNLGFEELKKGLYQEIDLGATQRVD